jgi:hypothetical protein
MRKVAHVYGPKKRCSHSLLKSPAAAWSRVRAMRIAFETSRPCRPAFYLIDDAFAMGISKGTGSGEQQLGVVQCSNIY